MTTPIELSEIHATLVVGANGATSIGGVSRGLATGEDRARFLALRSSSDFGAIIVGARTAASEPYAKTPHPLFVYRRESGLSAGQFIESVRKQVSGKILCEGGISLLHLLLHEECIDLFHLSRTPVMGDDHFLDESLLREKMSLLTSETLGQTTFERYERASRRVE